MAKVVFKREEKDGLLLSKVWVNDETLEFDANEEASMSLEADSICDVYWRIVGDLGSSLVVTKSRANEDPVTIVKSSIRKSDKGRRRDFTIFKA